MGSCSLSLSPRTERSSTSSTAPTRTVEPTRTRLPRTLISFSALHGAHRSGISPIPPPASFLCFAQLFRLLLTGLPSVRPQVTSTVADGGIRGDGKPSRGGGPSNFRAVKCNPRLSEQARSLRGVVAELLSCANPEKPIVSLGVGDLSSHACFRKARDFSKYVAEAVSSGDFDGYPPSCGYPFARR